MEWKMPDLGEGVQEGEIVKWLVKEGEKISHDQHLVEIMTDKATMEIPSPTDGVIEKILVKEGQIAKVGQVMAEIHGGAAPFAEKRVEEKKQPSVEKREIKKEMGPRPLEAPRSTKALASPFIRQMARDRGIDLEVVSGSGPDGRITQSDVLSYARRGSSGPLQAGETQEAPSPLPSFGPEERVALKGLRRKIAEHMIASRRTAAHFTHVDEADFTKLIAFREKAKKIAEPIGVKLTYLPYIIKAVIKGLKKYRTMNASLDDSSHEIVIKNYYNIGVAVATEEGLIVPVIKNADQRDILDLAKEISRLSDAARARKIALEDLKGGTFTLTNIGSIGGVFSAPIINWPEVAIMGLHKIKPTPVVRENAIVVRQIMTISISADHRVVDGAEVAAFLKEVIQFIETPEELA